MHKRSVERFPPATFGNAVTGELSAAATSGGYLSANVAAGDATTVARTLSERVHAMTEKGVHEARLRLTPAELGDIAIVVRKSPMQLSVSLQVARPEALSLVQGTAALLRDMLSQRHAGEVQVSVAGMPSDGGDGGRDTRASGIRVTNSPVTKARGSRWAKRHASVRRSDYEHTPVRPCRATTGRKAR
ncbi:flagellar hook-length control protein FliK [Pandoraea apista]|uniref:flagellar hook-length control protein FliK n=1 Tax=Pandoraea apista TaxID=93218 RepID=UPI000F67F104|nr:flagellar hook-length control protein FliK [Pandoraea apista]RSD21630.1 flagellar hook-length control protein FliK [Pandoraea apista]